MRNVYAQREETDAFGTVSRVGPDGKRQWFNERDLEANHEYMEKYGDLDPEFLYPSPTPAEAYLGIQAFKRRRARAAEVDTTVAGWLYVLIFIALVVLVIMALLIWGGA